jgi:hypothetical protein
MANTRIVFMGSENTEGHQIEINENCLMVEITLTTDSVKSNIFLDLPTAIKFSKVLKHTIFKAKSKEEELENE